MGVQPSEMNLNENYPLQLAQQTPQTVYDHFLQQKQQQQQSIQQMEQDTEMLYDQSTGGTDLNISASTCTTSMLFRRPFVSSLSTGRDLDENALSLLQAACSTDQNSHQHKRKCFGRGDDGSVKCWSSGRCHCSKKRSTFIAILSSLFDMLFTH